MTTITEAQAALQQSPPGRRVAPGPPPRHPGTVAVLDGKVITGPAPRNGPRPVDGARLWLLVRGYLSHYVAFRTEEELDRATAWAFHACARRRGELGMGPLIWNATPRLLIKSRRRGAGKSTLLDLLVLLTGSHNGKVPRITPARLAQIIGQAHEGAFIDEGRLVFGAGARHEDLQACLLAGYTPGTAYAVSKTKLSLFGPVAIASKESLITEASKAVDGDESSLGDLLDRCLTVTLTAPDFPMPEVGKRARAEGEMFCRALITWTDANRDALEQAAEDIADEDYEVTQQRAADGEQAAHTPRALQIGRPLRAIGRAIDQQVIAEARRRGGDAEPQFEATIQACLGSQTEDIMGELEQFAERWGEARFTGEDDDVQFPDVQFPDEPGGLAAFAPAEAGYTAGYATTEPGQRPSAKHLPGPFDTLEDAQRACEDHSGGPLRWEHAGQGTWGATVYDGPIETAYVVSGSE